MGLWSQIPQRFWSKCYPDVNVIQIQMLSTFLSKILANCQAWSVNQNFVVSLKTDVLTKGMFWPPIFPKKLLKVICKKAKLVGESRSVVRLFGPWSRLWEISFNYVIEWCIIKLYQGNILLFKVNVTKFQSGGLHQC